MYVPDVKGFRIRQKIKLEATGLNAIYLDIINVYPDHLIVGNFENKQPANISAYTVALSANISADEQEKKYITQKEILQYVHEAEPINALRTHNVDEEGSSYNSENPLPIKSSENSLTNNLLAMLVNTDINRDIWIVTNDNFFVYDNDGNLIKEG